MGSCTLGRSSALNNQVCVALLINFGRSKVTKTGSQYEPSMQFYLMATHPVLLS